MNSSRLEAYNNAILAIVMTLMVLNIEPPTLATIFVDLKPIVFKVVVYIFSFIILAIYWNNLHALFQNVKTINSCVV